MQADIAVYGPDQRLELVVEVKNRVGASRDWAMAMRENLLTFGAIPREPFFLLALSQHFYLWNKDTRDPQAPPDYEVPADRVLAYYLQGLDRPLIEFGREGLELLVSSWLQDLVATLPGDPSLGSDISWLIESGLYAAVQGGHVLATVAV